MTNARQILSFALDGLLAHLGSLSIPINRQLTSESWIALSHKDCGVVAGVGLPWAVRDKLLCQAPPRLSQSACHLHLNRHLLLSPHLLLPPLLCSSH